jgi:hypothetical protein
LEYQARADLVQDGNFESGALNTYWTITDATGYVGLIGQTLAGNPGPNPAPNAMGGTGLSVETDPSLSAALGSTNGNFAAYIGNYPDFGSISQTIATTPNLHYTLKFDVQNLLGAYGADFNVYWGGNEVFTASGVIEHATDYLTVILPELMATSGNTDLTFSARNANSYTFLDNISVTLSGPEPSTLTIAVIGSALAGVFGFRRRRNLIRIQE